MNEFNTIGFDIKYRPKNLKEIVGQSDVVDQINGFFKTKQIPKSLLFCGPSGVGKTTCARIIANHVNNSDEDTKEENIGIDRGIDVIRSIVENASFKPKNNLRFIILDEIHSLTQNAANAILKSLEEPPPHIVYILITNQPEKILQTIKNRCEKVIFKLPESEDIFILLKRIYKKAKLDWEKNYLKILKYISKNCGNTPREAIQMLSAFNFKYETSKNNNINNIDKILNELFDIDIDKKAAKLIRYLYSNSSDINKYILPIILQTNELNTLLFKSIDINMYMLYRGVNQGSYLSNGRKLLLNYIKGKNIDLNKCIEVHKKLISIKKDMMNGLITDKDLFIMNLCI